MTTAAPPARELVRSHVTLPPRAAVRQAEPDPQRHTLERSTTLPVLQPRLLVGPVDDPYEREADRAAETVAHGATTESRDRAGGFDLALGLSRLVRRAMAKAEPPTHKDDERKEEDDKKKVVQKRASAAGPSAVPIGVAASINQAMTSGGAPLAATVRTTFEQRFGHDLAGVRVHTDGTAAEATTVLGAKAFTIGEHVFFAAGEYQPGSRLGQWLIAHELAHVVQQAPPGQVRRRPIITWEIAGARFYRTRNGDDIKLPEDMSAQEVAQLEDDAIAAEHQLAELPPPKPVPEVRKPSPKPAVPHAAKARPRRKRGKGQAPPKLGEAAAALLKAVGRGKTAAYLAAKGAPVFAQGAAKLARLRGHEQAHDDGGEKLRKSEDAVVIPASEEQSASNAVQVAQVDDRQVPAVDETRGKGTLERSLNANVPRSVGELDNFKRDQKASHTSAAVLVVAQGDKDSVIGTFGDVRATPPPIPSTKDEAELPPPEGAPATPTMHLGRGAIAPLLKEHTDVSDYTKQADAKLKDEGVTQEQLDMVDSGELAEANKEKKRMVVQAATEPVAVQQIAQEERARVDKDLEAEEHVGRAALVGRRKGALATTGHKQKDAKRDLEKKRDDVAKEINNRYKAVQDHVKSRLTELDVQSMKRFDEGQADAARAFENDVNRELQDYKNDRYSGWFGWARKAKDWVRGMDKLPKVKAIFDSNRAAFERRISKLVEDITADDQRVIRECHEELEAARTKIDEYVAGLEPSLQGIGKKAAGEMQEKLDLLDKDIANKEQELQNKLKDKQTAAIRAIDEKIEKMKESMSGALSKVGRLLVKAAKKFFTWALEKFGLSLSTIESVIDKGIAVLKAIFTGPIQFVKNLIAGAKLGLANFGKNFVTHLKDALFEWLTDSLQGVTLPDTWTVKGIVSVLLQVVGISWVNLKARLVRLIPAPVVETLQTTFTLVKTLVVEGPMAAWEQIKEMGEELKKAFVSAITDWLKWKVVEEAVKMIAALFIPGAGIVRAIVGIYDTIVFFVQKARDILQMVGDFLGSIADIAAGKIDAAADALERGLARGLKLVIVFLAKLLRLDGIAARIRAVLEAIRNKVDAVLDKVASWIVGLAKKAGKLGKDGEELVSDASLGAPPEATFADEEGTHHLSVRLEGGVYVAIVSSETKHLDEFLDLAEKNGKFNAKAKAAQLADARTAISTLRTALKNLSDPKQKKNLAANKAATQVAENAVASALKTLLAGVDINAFDQRYKLEGLVGTYGSMPRQSGDKLTPDHQPQAALVKYVADLEYFDPATKTTKLLFAGRHVRTLTSGHATGAVAINLHENRHKLGLTYGRSVPDKVIKDVDAAVTPGGVINPAVLDRKRTKVIGHVRDQLDLEVDKMVTVAGSKASYPDVVAFAGDDKKAKPIIEKIKGQIVAGEERVRGTDLDGWTA
jgi:hypothetical protein